MKVPIILVTCDRCTKEFSVVIEQEQKHFIAEAVAQVRVDHEREYPGHKTKQQVTELEQP